MTLSLVVYAVSFLVCVLFMAFFAGFEAAFGSLSKVKLRHAVDQDVTGAAFLADLYVNREKLLGFTLASTTLSMVAASVLAYKFFALPPFAALGEAWRFALAIAVAAPIMAVFGETFPRTLCRKYANELVFHFVLPIRVTYYFFYYPTVLFAHSVARFAQWLFGAGSSGLRFRASQEELRLLIRAGQQEGILENEEGEMIRRIFELRDKTVEDVMVPRADVVAADVSASPRELAERIEASGYTRIPLYKETPDAFVGVVHAYDVYKALLEERGSVRGSLGELKVVPRRKPLHALLKEFQAEHLHLAVVMEERGGLAGLVTIEDILEEIVGEIEDEFDPAEPKIKRVSPGVYAVDATVEASEAAEILGISLPEGTFDSFGGWLLSLWKRIPVQGEERETAGLRITVVKADPQRIYEARVTVLSRESGEAKRLGSENRSKGSA